MSNKESNVTPPRRGTVKRAGVDTVVRNVQYVAITTSSARTEIDEQLRLRWVTIKAIGADATFCFSPDNAGDVDHTLTGGQAVTANIGYTLLAGTEKDFLLGGQDNYIIVDGSAAGTLQLHGSGSRLPNKEGP